jgi:hypothetical protein
MYLSSCLYYLSITGWGGIMGRLTKFCRRQQRRGTLKWLRRGKQLRRRRLLALEQVGEGEEMVLDSVASRVYRKEGLWRSPACIKR